jgi:hypothetical protein
MRSATSEEVRVGTQEDTSTTITGHERARVGDERLGVIHQGSRYVFGYASTFYGIWDESDPARPVERFPTTAEGRTAAWERYRELDAGAADVDPVSIGFPPPPVQEARRSRRAWIIAGILVAAVVIAVVAVVASGSGKKEASTSPGTAGGGSKAHVDVTGGTPVTEDLTGKMFAPKGLDSLYPSVDASWSGSQTLLRVHLLQPHDGENPTGRATQNELDLTVNGVAFNSTAGECEITLKGDVTEDGMSGSFTCTQVPPSGSGTPIDAKGTFSASK